MNPKNSVQVALTSNSPKFDVSKMKQNLLFKTWNRNAFNEILLFSNNYIEFVTIFIVHYYYYYFLSLFLSHTSLIYLLFLEFGYRQSFSFWCVVKNLHRNRFVTCRHAELWTLLWYDWCCVGYIKHIRVSMIICHLLNST